MATITKSEDAPDGVVSFSFGHDSFSLDSPKDVFETDAPALLGDAATHPWLSVSEVAAEVAPEEPVITSIFGSNE